MNTERSMDRMELMMKARAQAHTLQAHIAETEENIIERRRQTTREWFMKIKLNVLFIGTLLTRYYCSLLDHSLALLRYVCLYLRDDSAIPIV